MGEIAIHWIESGEAERTAERKRHEARARQKIAAEILAGLDYQSHPNSYCLWLHCPPGRLPVEVALEARRRGVAVTPSRSFAIDEERAPAALRICLSAARNREELTRGVDHLETRPHGRPLIVARSSIAARP